jgi:hypothetical protein
MWHYPLIINDLIDAQARLLRDPREARVPVTSAAAAASAVETPMEVGKVRAYMGTVLVWTSLYQGAWMVG